MSGADKYWMTEELKKLGWKEDTENDNHLIPPDDLWKNKPKSFYVWDANELQDLLGIELRKGDKNDPKES